MEYRKLGNSGAVVTAYCLGTMTFGKESDEATSFALMNDYVEAGGNFLDTADVYSAGVSEEIIGRWLKSRPGDAQDLVIATKGRFPMGQRAPTISACRASIWARRSTPRCGAWGSSRSTSTRCTPGTR